MQRIIAKTSCLIITVWLGFFVGCLLPGACCGAMTQRPPAAEKPLILLLPQSPLGKLQRPPVVFNHDLHTSTLRQLGQSDCTVCHVMEESPAGSPQKRLTVFRFPKVPVDPLNRTAVMRANHNECVSCHRKMASAGKRSGPDIGLCGRCHVKTVPFKETKWAWKPIFNYVTHYKHLRNIETHKVGAEFAIVKDIKIDPAVTGEGKRCELCHHSVDESTKKLIYKKDTGNACGSCHKAQDEKNVRSLKKVVHAACITCHMKTHELIKKAGDIRSERKWGPYDCKGCHGEHKVPTREEIQQLPRLVRGQKDVLDLSYTLAQGQTQTTPLPTVRMKAVPFNHKLHEPRVEFCSSCHHYSLNKCAECHPLIPDVKKGGGVSYERAYHTATAREACVGCHNTEKNKTTCAGCHSRKATQLSQTSCQMCHRGPSDGKWSESPLISDVIDLQKIPEKIKINVLRKEFEPVDLQHIKIIKKLIGISNQNPMAKWFHNGNQRVMCDSCHHHTPPEAENSVPKCISCHGRSFDPAILGRPGILAAYHRQCMECHENMKQKPLSLECTKCHAEKGKAVTTALSVGKGQTSKP